MITTKRVETSNPELKLQKSRNVEAGMEFDAGKVSGSLVYFNESMKDGYTFATEYVPMTFMRYGYTWKNGVPSQTVLPSGKDVVWRVGGVTADGQSLPSIQDTTFLSLSRPVNGVSLDKWGVEFTFDVAKIPSIGTSINVSGAYMNVTTYGSALTQRLYAGTQNGRTYPWVGVYGGSSTTSNGSVKERFNTNVRFITHIPQLAMVVTLTAQMVFFETTRNLCEFEGQQRYYEKDGTLCVNPLYIIDRKDRLIPFTDEMAADPQYRNLILTTNTPTFYVKQTYPFYGMLNLRLSKEIGRVATVSFYANNFLNLRGRVRNSVTGYPNDRNTPLYFGAEVKISIR